MAASYGSAVFVGISTKQTIYKDIYLDDTAGNPVRFDSGAGASATSPVFMIANETMYLKDVCIASATGQTKTQINRNDIPTGAILRNSLHLASVVNRPNLAIRYAQGSRVTMTQLA